MTGYPCPECGEWTGVARGRHRDELGRFARRRVCSPCGLNFATIEVLSPVSAFRMSELSSHPVLLNVTVEAA